MYSYCFIKKKKIDITDRFQKASEIISYRGPDDTSFIEDENMLHLIFLDHNKRSFYSW